MAAHSDCGDLQLAPVHLVSVLLSLSRKCTDFTVLLVANYQPLKFQVRKKDVAKQLLYASGKVGII